MKSIFIAVIIYLIIGISGCGNSTQKRKELAYKSRNSSSTSNTPQHAGNNEAVSIPVSSSNSGRVMSGSEIFDCYNTAVFMVFTSDGWSNFQGSGFFISDKGIAVSNYHVFKGTTIGYENIKLADGNLYKVEEVIDWSEYEDYIIFKVELGKERVNFIPIASQNPKVGEPAYAIGSPRGLENTFSSGEISQIRDENILQISVPIDHGSSGGALLNKYGEVIGITTSGRDDSGANLNFAMSIKVINKHLR